MKKVITYGTYDLLHYGHIRLLERAKALGDYLIVGVTAEDFDKARGKINVQQSLMERIDAVKQTGIADEVIVEEYEGQKIDDIRRYDVDIFAIGSDWDGVFDYLNEYCEVVYLPRTEGISSTELRSEKSVLKMGFVGSYSGIRRYADEAKYVNGLEVTGIYCTRKGREANEYFKDKTYVANDYESLVDISDALYVVSHPSIHYEYIKTALQAGKHVLCEAPITLSTKQTRELIALAHEKGVILMDSIKTAFATAYNRLVLLVKGGKIGKVISVDSVCTSQAELNAISNDPDFDTIWNSICAWGPTAMLPIFQILGTDYVQKQIISNYLDREKKFDKFTKVAFIYPHAVASLKVGKGVKSEGELIISGTKGYVYVPAPWWKTNYFEIRYENQAENQRYFYQSDGDGIRFELLSFLRAVQQGKSDSYISESVTMGINKLIEDFYTDTDSNIEI